MKREFVINRQGKDYVLYAGLLDLAHQQGLTAIKTQLVQVPSAGNGQVAICVAEVTTERGTFTGIGDADPSNVARMMANALIRMAETRAKARALRDAVNVGMASLEELAETSAESGPAPSPAIAPDEQPVPAPGPPIGPAPSRGAGEIVAFPGPRNTPAAPSVVAVPAMAAEAQVTPAEGGRGAGPAGRPGVRPVAGSRGTTDVAPLPPTQTQLETIAKLARSTGRTVSTEGLTRAAASDLITRLSEERYGARRNP